jgi:hypothetical protein
MVALRFKIPARIGWQYELQSNGLLRAGYSLATDLMRSTFSLCKKVVGWLLLFW